MLALVQQGVSKRARAWQRGLAGRLTMQGVTERAWFYALLHAAWSWSVFGTVGAAWLRSWQCATWVGTAPLVWGRAAGCAWRAMACLACCLMWAVCSAVVVVGLGSASCPLPAAGPAGRLGWGRWVPTTRRGRRCALLLRFLLLRMW